MSRGPRTKHHKRILPYGVREAKEHPHAVKVSYEEFKLLATEHFDVGVCLEKGGAEAYVQLCGSHAAVETFRRNR